MDVVRRTAAIGVASGCVLAAVLLAGCAPTGSSVSGGGCDPHGIAALQPDHCQGDVRKVDAERQDTSGGSSGCDPHGFGPFSGCGDSDQGDDFGNNDSYTSGDGPLPQDYYFRARHEAGHKNCAEEFGMNVTSVWLHADGEGRTNISGFRFKDPQQRLIVLYCGEIAAGTSKGTVGESSDGHPGDRQQEEKIISSYPVDEGAAWSEAERIVGERSPQIDRDATALLSKGELS